MARARGEHLEETNRYGLGEKKGRCGLCQERKDILECLVEDVQSGQEQFYVWKRSNLEERTGRQRVTDRNGQRIKKTKRSTRSTRKFVWCVCAVQKCAKVEKFVIFHRLQLLQFVQCSENLTQLHCCLWCWHSFVTRTFKFMHLMSRHVNSRALTRATTSSCCTNILWPSQKRYHALLSRYVIARASKVNLRHVGQNAWVHGTHCDANILWES